MLFEEFLEGVLLFLRFLLLLHLLLHLHKLFDFHSLLDFFLPLAFFLSEAFLFEAGTFLGRDFLLLELGIRSVVFSFPVADPLPLLDTALVRLDVTLSAPSFHHFVVLLVFFDQALAFLLALLLTFNLALLGTLAGLLSQKPVVQFLAEALLLVPLHLRVPLLSLYFTLVVLVLVGEGVVDEHIFTVDNSHGSPRRLQMRRLTLLAAETIHVRKWSH